MKKILGITIGGLKQKLLSLVVVVFLIMLVFISIISVYKTKYLANVVNSTNEVQQVALSDVSAGTIQEVLASTVTKTNSLQAFIADDMFEEIETDVTTLQALAVGYFSHKGAYEDAAFFPPNPAMNGTITAQALWDETVEHYDESEYLPIAAHMSDVMIAMCESSGYMDNCYIGFEDGTSLCIDAMSANKFDSDGNIIYFPARERPWYTSAVAAGDMVISGVIYDTFSGRSCVTCSAPIYVNDEIIGVVGIDLFLDQLEEYVNESTRNGGFICIVNDQGQVIFAPEGNGLFEIAGSDDAPDLRASSNSALAEFITEALVMSTDLETIEVNGNEYYMAGSPITTVGWTAISVVEKDITETPTVMMLEEYDRINTEARENYKSAQTKLMTLSAILVGLIMLAGVIAALIMADRIVKPIESMTRDIIDGANSGKLFEMKPIYNTNDEIEILAESFDDLSKKTKQYIMEITQITKESERISTELALATRIQASMIPHDFPPFPDRKEFDLYAVMDPAREVGGDFYDYYLIDDDHLAILVADVSGKGIPAALFMMISKTILQSCAMLGKSPAEILDKTNLALTTNNMVEMFVTVWIGILEISTGKLTAANAGHEYPVIKRGDGKFEIFKERHSLAVGAMEDTVYHEYDIELKKGDKLFIYTDGVPEATDAEEHMFGPDRMLEALNIDPDADPETLLINVKKAVSDFVKDAEQFDDLTMLGFEYHGK